MALDIFFAEDIRNALLAADEASASTARVCANTGGDPATLRAYLEGYRAALSTLALAFGIAPTIVTIFDDKGVIETIPILAEEEGEVGK